MAETPGTLVTDVESSRVEQCLPPEVQYACLYWIPHLQKSGAQLYDNDEVHHFLQEHFLHWLEALSWMRKTSEGIHTIASLESTALVSELTTQNKYLAHLSFRIRLSPTIHVYLRYEAIRAIQPASVRASPTPDILQCTYLCTNDKHREKSVSRPDAFVDGKITLS